MRESLKMKAFISFVKIKFFIIFYLQKHHNRMVLPKEKNRSLQDMTITILNDNSSLKFPMNYRRVGKPIFFISTLLNENVSF
ncbi:hypothetical protein CR513_41371, partial [Mucuna pruriens]